jgi:hypothetical protein
LLFIFACGEDGEIEKSTEQKQTPVSQTQGRSF